MHAQNLLVCHRVAGFGTRVLSWWIVSLKSRNTPEFEISSISHSRPWSSPKPAWKSIHFAFASLSKITVGESHISKSSSMNLFSMTKNSSQYENHPSSRRIPLNIVAHASAGGFHIDVPLLLFAFWSNHQNWVCYSLFQVSSWELEHNSDQSWVDFL